MGQDPTARAGDGSESRRWSPGQLTLPDADQYGTLTEVFADRDYEPVDGKGQVTIDGAGYRWLAAVRSEDIPALR